MNILIISVIFTFQKTKEVEEEKISLINLELASEKKIANQLKGIPKKVERLNYSTQNKLLRIKVSVFNLNFTFDELFKT
ncbi:hypothetical protein [Polaribacter atrinae]|uniref:Uncharacterized protein n=1 Tax=Polaribacter atrinae TaxID=1333662 RepID=A0A176TH56_9FLAO|nr:hypothetical protein [Polaribacter atrinae]OAD46706.1 hypothetical protein LPB303_00170 [Polaribacter atrinae]